MHEHLHAVGTPVGEEIGMVRMRGAEDRDQAKGHSRVGHKYNMANRARLRRPGRGRKK